MIFNFCSPFQVCAFIFLLSIETQNGNTKFSNHHSLSPLLSSFCCCFSLANVRPAVVVTFSRCTSRRSLVSQVRCDVLILRFSFDILSVCSSRLCLLTFNNLLSFININWVHVIEDKYMLSQNNCDLTAGRKKEKKNWTRGSIPSRAACALHVYKSHTYLKEIVEKNDNETKGWVFNFAAIQFRDKDGKKSGYNGLFPLPAFSWRDHSVTVWLVMRSTQRHSSHLHCTVLRLNDMTVSN